MSYVRFGNDSDVYVYDDIYAGLVIFVAGGAGERLIIGEGAYPETLKKLEELKKFGYKVPDRAFERLKNEMEKR